AICAPNCISRSSENCFRKRAYKSSETFAGVSVIASASSMTMRSVSLKGVRSSLRTASNLSSVRPAFLPTAELTSIQKGHPTRGSDFSRLNVTQRDNSFADERGFHDDAVPDERGQTHLDLCRRKIFPEHFSHYAVKPPQMPRCVFLFQT